VAPSTPPADQTLELQVLGRPFQAEDWLKDIRLRTSLLFLPLPVRDVNRLLATRTAKRSAWAIPHGERIIKSLENRTEAFLIEVNRIREAVEASAYVESASGTAIAEAYLDDLEFETKEIIEDRLKLQAEWNLLRPSGPVRPNDRVTQVLRYLEQAMLERGADRGVLLREARNALIEIGNSQPVVHPILWLVQAWATWQLTDNYLEALPILQRVDQHPIPSVASALAYRLLAHFSQLHESPNKAFEYAQKSLFIRDTSDSLLDAALCASALHDPQNAKAYYEKALIKRPGVLITALSDDQCLITGTELLEVAVRVQLNLRRDGRRAVSDWVSAVRQVVEAQRTCPGGLHMPHELMEGHKFTLQRLEDCDLAVGGYLTRTSRENALEVMEAAQKSLQSEYVKRADAVSMARRSIDSAAIWRDERLREAASEQEAVNRRATAMLTNFDSHADRAEKGSLFGFGGGCVLFALYMVSFLILSDRGVPIGVTTPVGFVATAVSTTPILIAIGLQVANGFKRLALESRVQETFKNSKSKTENASADVEDDYREQVKQHRRALAAADGELKRVESAMRCLGFKHPVEAVEAEVEVLTQEQINLKELSEIEAELALEEPAA
jgi:tetratricopeptide (TPR) repeat protein